MMINILLKALQVLSLLVIVKALLPYFVKAQNKWTVLLDRIVAPILQIGKKIATKVLDGRVLPFDVVPLVSLFVLWLAQFVIRILFT